MNKSYSLVIGFGLILLGIAAFACNAVTLSAGIPLWRSLDLFWPLAVIGVALGFLLSPLVFRQRWLGVLAIPGAVVLVTGGILAFTNFTRLWNAWAYLWPWEVLGLALGFVLAALICRSAWFLLPAIILGLNGAVLFFCAVTGLWGSWALLWTVEPLAVGLVLLVISAKTRSRAVMIVGLSLCSFAAFAFTGMGMLLAWDGWLFRLALPVTFICAGALIAASSFLKARLAPAEA